MNPLVAAFICACGIAGLFYLDRDKSVRTSKALWLPVTWIGVVCSRSVSEWLGIAPTGANVQYEGSPIDAAIFGVLLVAAIGVLIARSTRTRVLLVSNWPILLYFFYCLLSVSWSSNSDISFKRWIKAIGDFAMVLIIVTDRKPVIALARLISRVGFVILPASVLFIKYFPLLGRGYTPDGAPMNTGVSTNKNMLGVALLVISLCTLWRFMAILRAKGMPDRRRHLLAQGTLLGFGIVLFWMAHSSTAIACFVLGGGLMLATNLRSFRSRPARIHALCFAIIFVGVVAFLLGGEGVVSHALGRESSLSGRTEIWAALIPAAPNSVIGAGFEDFWIGPNVSQFRNSMVGWWHAEDLNEAHNGYLEVYLNLGCIGVALISIILATGYGRAVKAYRRNQQVGGLFLTYIMVSAVYSITEAGFRMMDPMWIFLLLAIVGSSSVNAGLFGREGAKVLTSPAGTTRKTPAWNELPPTGEIVYTASRGLAQSEFTGTSNLR
jgi:exopolysaccharide production protein ExoQ